MSEDPQGGKTKWNCVIGDKTKWTRTTKTGRKPEDRNKNRKGTNPLQGIFTLPSIRPKKWRTLTVGKTVKLKNKTRCKRKKSVTMWCCMTVRWGKEWPARTQGTGRKPQGKTKCKRNEYPWPATSFCAITIGRSVWQFLLTTICR